MMNILIPMAGRGSRFSEKGYQLPKPLIDVNGKSMIERVIENIGLEGRHIFIILKEHAELLMPVLQRCAPNCVTIEIDTVTQGAACTCLLAEEYINNDEHLLIANCDQLMEWDREDFLSKIKEDVDGYILTFTSDEKKHSYAKLNRHGCIIKVAEKEVISDIATVGVYHWAKGRYMVDSCKNMIEKNIRTNSEFYLCPSYNQMIEEGYILKTLHIGRHHPIGTPEDLEQYLDYSKNV
jgi:dTDP-glucose pyrophosphorylase